MKAMTKLGVAVLAVGLLIAGAEGVALAGHGNVYVPDYNYPMDTTQPGWIHNIQGGGYVGYPPDYSTAPDNTGWSPMESTETGVSAAPQTSQAQPAVPVAPFLGNDQRSSHSS